MQALTPAAGGVVLDGLNLTLVLVVLVISLIALAMGAMFRGQVLAADPGTPAVAAVSGIPTAAIQAAQAGLVTDMDAIADALYARGDWAE